MKAVVSCLRYMYVCVRKFGVLMCMHIKLDERVMFVCRDCCTLCMYVRMHVCTCVCVCVHVCVCMCVCANEDPLESAFLHGYTQKYMHAYIHMDYTTVHQRCLLSDCRIYAYMFMDVYTCSPHAICV